MKVDMSPEAVTQRLRTMDELWVLSVKLMNSNPAETHSASSNEKRVADIMDAIRHILFFDWDPIGVNTRAQIDEYDAYIGPVYQMLAENRSEEELAKLLIQFECDSMGLIERSPEQVRPAVRKLLALRVHLDG